MANKSLRKFIKEYRKNRPWYVNLYWDIRLRFLSYKYRWQDYKYKNK